MVLNILFVFFLTVYYVIFLLSNFCDSINYLVLEYLFCLSNLIIVNLLLYKILVLRKNISFVFIDLILKLL